MESGRSTSVRTKVGVMVMLTGLLTGLLAVIAPTVSAEPLPTGTLGAFENDGDQDDATLNTGTIDWETVKTDPRITEWLLIHDDGDTDTDDSSWIDSAKEQDPSTWGCAANEAPPKDDIFRLYLASQISQAGQFLHIGYVRASGTGDTNVNVEFNKVTGDFSCPANEGRVRSRDDLMLSFTFGGGADSSVIEVLRWDPTLAPDVPGDPAPGDPGQGGNDFVTADGHWDKVPLAPNVAKGSDNAAFNGGNKVGDLPKITDQFFDDSVLEPRTFGELTLDLGGIFGAGLLGCPGTGFVNVHSRASHDFASDLKEVFPETQFDLSNCASIKIKKVDNSVPPVAQRGAIYGLYSSQATANNVANNVDPLNTEAAAKAAAVSWCSTGADGTCLLHDADPGTDYWIAEITPPSGLLGSTEVRAVDDSQLEPFTTLDLSDGPGEPFVNNVPVGNVTITKRLFNDANNNDVLDPGEQITPDQASDLDGITFTLQQNSVTSKTHPANVDATCTITGGTGQCTISSVRLGTYQIIETLNPNGPSGIGLGISPSVTITTNGQTVTANYDNPLSPINIALDKLGDKDQANIGDTVNYTFTVTTTGVRLHNVTLAEWEGVLDSVTYADICDSGPTFDAALSTGEQDGFLNAGDSFIWKCPHLVTGTDPDPLPNRARAAGIDDVGRPTDAFDTFNVDILYPDLRVVKLAADGVDAGTEASASETIDAPGTASYTITVTNVGLGIARNATLTDTLPAGSWNVVLASPDGDDVCPVGGSPKSVSFTCTFGDLAPAASKTVTVSRAVTIATDCSAELTNNAGATTTYQTVDIDLNESNDSSSATINVRCPDVGVVKAAVSSAINAGDAAQWTITVTNNGAGVATDVHLTDTIPAGLTNLALGGADADDCDLDLVGRVVSCDFGDIAPNGSRVITVEGLTDPADCPAVSNTATVVNANGGAYVDTNAGNNSSTARVDVNCPDVNLNKVEDAAIVEAGDQIGFTITVTNLDDDEDPAEGVARDVVVVDDLGDLPGDLTWTVDLDGSNLPKDATCDIDEDGILTCDLGDLPAVSQGPQVTIHLVADTTEADCTVYDNTASATVANGVDPDDDSATSRVRCPISITLDKRGDTIAHVGDVVDYEFTATNTGGEDLLNVQLTDPECNVGSIILVDDADGDAVLAAGTWDAEDEEFLGGEVWSYTCERTLTAADVVVIDGNDFALNTGSVRGEDADGREATDTDPHVLEIITPVIQIVKTVDDDAPAVGQTVTFTYVVTNTGDTTLFNVKVVDDQLGDIGTIASLAAGASSTLTKTMVVAADSPTRNVGTATGADVLGKQVSSQDDATLTIVLGVVLRRSADRPPLAVAPPLAVTGSNVTQLVPLAIALALIGRLLAAWDTGGTSNRRLRRRAR